MIFSELRVRDSEELIEELEGLSDRLRQIYVSVDWDDGVSKELRVMVDEFEKGVMYVEDVMRDEDEGVEDC